MSASASVRPVLRLTRAPHSAPHSCPCKQTDPAGAAAWQEQWQGQAREAGGLQDSLRRGEVRWVGEGECGLLGQCSAEQPTSPLGYLLTPVIHLSLAPQVGLHTRESLASAERSAQHLEERLQALQQQQQGGAK